MKKQGDLLRFSDLFVFDIRKIQNYSEMTISYQTGEDSPCG